VLIVIRPGIEKNAATVCQASELVAIETAHIDE
jgi:hypothetical protein